MKLKTTLYIKFEAPKEVEDQIKHIPALLRAICEETTQDMITAIKDRVKSDGMSIKGKTSIIE